MKSPKKNPIAAVVLPLQGKQMEPDWQQQTKDFGGNFDRRNLSEMWRSPQWSSKFNNDVESLTKAARLEPFNNSPGK
jgi:hypothetical protein